jgi:hypothetical protein
MIELTALEIATIVILECMIQIVSHIRGKLMIQKQLRDIPLGINTFAVLMPPMV